MNPQTTKMVRLNLHALKAPCGFHKKFTCPPFSQLIQICVQKNITKFSLAYFATQFSHGIMAPL